jgi:hypothetical protein
MSEIKQRPSHSSAPPDMQSQARGQMWQARP